MEREVNDIEGLDTVSVDTDPSGPEPGYPAAGSTDLHDNWNLIHHLDAITAVYKNLCEGYGARTGISEPAAEAIARLEAVIHGMVMMLPVIETNQPPPNPYPGEPEEEGREDHDMAD